MAGNYKEAGSELPGSKDIRTTDNNLASFGALNAQNSATTNSTDAKGYPATSQLFVHRDGGSAPIGPVMIVHVFPRVHPHGTVKRPWGEKYVRYICANTDSLSRRARCRIPSETFRGVG